VSTFSAMIMGFGLGPGFTAFIAQGVCTTRAVHYVHGNG